MFPIFLPQSVSDKTEKMWIFVIVLWLKVEHLPLCKIQLEPEM